MKKLLFVSLFLAATFTLQASDKKKDAELYAKNNVKQITAIDYTWENGTVSAIGDTMQVVKLDNKGRDSETITYSTILTDKRITTYTYQGDLLKEVTNRLLSGKSEDRRVSEQSGNKIETLIYDGKNSFMGKSIIYKDRQDRDSVYLEYNADEEPVAEHIFRYNPAGKLSERIYTDGKNSYWEKLVPDSQVGVTYITLTLDDGKPVSSITYIYDAQGRVIEEVHKSLTEDYELRRTLHYNEKGLLSEATEFDEEANPINTTKYFYEYR